MGACTTLHLFENFLLKEELFLRKLSEVIKIILREKILLKESSLNTPSKCVRSVMPHTHKSMAR